MYCLEYVAVKFEVKLHLSPYRACGSGGLANSLGGANCVQNTGSAFAVPRPSPGFPSVAVHSPTSRHLQYAYCKQREAGQGPGKETSSAWCERLPEQQDLSFSSVVFYKSTALLLYGQYQVNIGIPKNRHPGCEFLSDAPFFGLSLRMQFKLALCACASGWSSTLEPRSKLGDDPKFGVSNVFEAARHMSETVEAFTRQVLLQFA